MSTLTIQPHEQAIDLADAGAAAVDTSAAGWKVTLKRGAISGVGVSVSGAGAYSKMEGTFSFKLKRLETSATYQKMVKDYSIGGGVHGFFAWLGFGANASTHKQEIQTAFHEISQSQEVDGTVDVDLMVTGMYPNVQVTASAFVLVLQITDDQGSSTTVFSNGDPTADVGAQDEDGHQLPTSDNSSTISI